MHLPSLLLLCLMLCTAAPSAFGRRSLAHVSTKSAAFVAAPAPAPAGMLPSNEGTNRIIDGAPDVNDWAYFTARIMFTDAACTGSLIGPAHVLTASLCLVRDDGSVKTCADVESVEIDGTQYSCGTLFAHTDFNPNFLEGPRDQPANDIGMIGLTTTASVQPIALASRGPAPNDLVFAAGYGRTESGEDAPLATTRMYTDMVVYDPALCAYGPFADDFCAGMGSIPTDQGVSDGGYTCNGDSGGPVVNEAFELTGVTSWGGENCLTTHGYYTRVADQLDHINAMVAAWPAVA